MTHCIVGLNPANEPGTPITKEKIVGEETKQGQKNPKYDRKTKRKLFAAIRKLHKAGVQYKEMVAPLTEQGFTRPNGEIIRASTIAPLGRRAGIKKRNGKPRGSKKITGKAPVTAPPSAPADPEQDTKILADLVLDAKISDHKKVEILRKLLRG